MAIANLAPMNLRQNPIAGNDYSNLGSLEVFIDKQEKDAETDVGVKNNVLKIELPDGNIEINFGGPQTKEKIETEFDENLALHVNPFSLSGIASELCRLIKQDDQSRAKWLEQYTQGLDLLGTEIESPRSNAADGSTAVEGQATVRNPLLLEAIVRFQSNARGELLPASGPVKIRNDGPTSNLTDVECNALEMDFNHYLTVTASEYYPDTERMFFSLGFCGTSFKKVYRCPIRRRPVSEYVDVRDIILSNAETSMATMPRITHVIKMTPSTIKRMQLIGVYRDVSLTLTQQLPKNEAEEKIDEMQGITPRSSSSMESDIRQIYECYCELNLQGFEHEDENGPTGLSLPYRVTIDVASQEILEIRRWWKEGDPSFLKRKVFVNYTFIPGIGFLGLGFLHLLGNTTMALTAGWRLCIDNGMFANFPGFLYSKTAGRNYTNEFRVPPGSGIAIDTGGQPIQNVVMDLPYRSVDGGFLNLLNMMQENGQRMAATADLNTGDGNSQAPVGTTIALIEQSQKVISAAHKRMHAAQAEEFQLLKELFKEDPYAFWENNAYPAGSWTPELLLGALDNVNIVPVADPNTPSQQARIQKAMLIKQLATSNPTLYDMKAVDTRILSMFDIDDVQSLFNKAPPTGPMSDPAAMMEAQAKMIDAQAKAAEVKVRAVDVTADAQNRAADRESKEKIALLQLAREIAVHPELSETATGVVGPALQELQQNPNV